MLLARLTGVALILAPALVAPLAAAPDRSLDLAGVAHLELPAGAAAEGRLVLERVAIPRIHVRPGERVLAAVRITGRVPLAREDSPLVEAQVVFETPSRALAQTVVIRARAMAVTVAAYEPRARFTGAQVTAPVPLPTWLSGPVEAYLVDHSQSVEQVAEADLYPDPLDPAPLGNRRPLIFIHGKDNHDLTESTHHAAKLAPFDGLRRSPDYPSLFRLYKPYFYVYPSYRSAAENGASLVRLVRERLGEMAPDRVAALAHSMGGLVLRRAMAHQGFSSRLGLGITTSAPHHGAIASSLIFANGRISERIGALAALLLRYGSSGEPDTAGLRSVAWDNYDSGITQDEERTYGVYVNRDLAAFNATFAHAGRLVTMMGDVHSLLGHHTAFGIKDEAYRRVQGAWGPRYANADPMVCHWSGTYEGAPVRARIVFPNFDHEQIVGSPKAVASILRLLKGEGLALP